MTTYPRVLFLLLLFGMTTISIITSQTLSASEIRLIPLQHRTAEELIPLLQPLNSRVTLTGNGYQLMARGGQADLAELETLVAQLDQALRQFLVRVRFSGSQAGGEASQSGHVRIQTGNTTNAAIGGSVIRHSTTERAQDGYLARATEGMPTWINTGSQKPGVLVESYNPVRGGGIILQSDPVQTSSGFYAKVRANGNQVTIEIASQKSSFDQEHSRQVNSQQMQTQVTGRLGEWIELGGVDQSTEVQGSGTLHSTQRNSQHTDNILLQVEEVQP